FPIADKVNQAEFECLMCLPKLCVVNINYAAPKFRFGQMLLPVAKMLAIECRKLWRRPGFGMNSVCDAGNRYFMDWNARPDILPKRSGDFAVQFAYPIGVPAKTQRQDGHAKRVVWIESCVAE